MINLFVVEFGMFFSYGVYAVKHFKINVLCTSLTNSIHQTPQLRLRWFVVCLRFLLCPLFALVACSSVVFTPEQGQKLYD
jgi:hypothetical protein